MQACFLEPWSHERFVDNRRILKGGFCMGQPTPLQLSSDLLTWLSDALADYEVRQSDKSFIAGALLVGGLHHYNAICYLVKAGAHSSAFALLRVEWQALINGLWMQLCCPEDQAAAYFSGKEFPGITKAINLVEKALAPLLTNGRKPFTEMRLVVGESMNVYTHMGSLQIQGFTKGREITSNFSDKQVAELLSISARIALYIATAMAWLNDDDTLENRIYAKFVEFQEAFVRLEIVHLRP
jgi:hypothetical protein